jgi:hypothetical protein
MSDQGVTIRLDRQPADYRHGDELTGSIAWQGGEASAVELSVLWHTEGRGVEDLGVHHFERLASDTAPLLAGVEHRFATRLPATPSSYEGLVVKVCWCVRGRVFLREGDELVGEARFRLGTVSPAQEVSV